MSFTQEMPEAVVVVLFVISTVAAVFFGAWYFKSFRTAQFAPPAFLAGLDQEVKAWLKENVEGPITRGMVAYAIQKVSERGLEERIKEKHADIRLKQTAAMDALSETVASQTRITVSSVYFGLAIATFFSTWFIGVISVYLVPSYFSVLGLHVPSHDQARFLEIVGNCSMFGAAVGTGFLVTAIFRRRFESSQAQ